MWAKKKFFVYNPFKSMFSFLNYVVIERIGSINKILFSLEITKDNRCKSGEYKILKTTSKHNELS